MKKTLSLLAFSAVVLVVSPRAGQAQTLAQWNFNSVTNDATTSTGSLNPSTGTGTLTLVGGTTSTFSAGSPGDPNTTDNSGLQTTGYPAQGTGSGTAGVQFAVSTAGLTGAIQLSLDFRQSGTQSRAFQLQLSTNGTIFTNASGGTATVAGPVNSNANTSFNSAGLYLNDAGTSQTFVQGITYTLPAGSAYANDPNFAFRWVSVFDPAAGTYVASNPANTYAATGTARFDLVTVAAAVPEPSTYVWVGAAGLGLVAFARRRPARV